MDVSVSEQLIELPDEVDNCGNINKVLKGGDERPRGTWWVVSFSSPRCEFSPTSQDRACTHAWAYAIAGTPIDEITREGLAKGPLV